MGERIRRGRTRKGWLQRDLAEKVGVKPEYISHIEKDRRVPAGPLALRIAKALELDPTEFAKATAVHRNPELEPYL